MAEKLCKLKKLNNNRCNLLTLKITSQLWKLKL